MTKRILFLTFLFLLGTSQEMLYKYQTDETNAAIAKSEPLALSNNKIINCNTTLTTY